MNLFLIRHAAAEDATPDESRRLTRSGRADARALGVFLRKSGAFTPDEIWHSTLVRARETAGLIAAELRKAPAPVEVAGLAPEDDPAAFARRLRAGAESIAVVGHQPFLGALASLLVTGAAEPPRFAVRKCAVIALEGTGRSWIVRWHLSPELIR